MVSAGLDMVYWWNVCEHGNEQSGTIKAQAFFTS
jgi:hypothetical protein